MTNIEKIYKNIQDEKPTFIFDDYEDAVLKVTPDEKNYIKKKGEQEKEIEPTTKLAFDIKQGGEIVTEKFYLEF